MKLIIGLMALLSLSVATAGEIKLVKVKELGAMKHKVIFQSADVKAIKGSNMVRGKLVAQWGTQVFEVATGFYTCNKNNTCKLTDFERVAMYESCKVKGNKVSCSKKISGDDSSNDSRDVITTGNPDAIEDGPARDNGVDTDFPVRIQDEFSDIF